MAEENGGRLDRIEHILDMLIADHEHFRHDLKQLLTSQVLLQGDLMRLTEIVKENTHQLELMRENDKNADERIQALVSAIGEFIRRQQPTPPA